MTMNAEQFEQATGFPPDQDDLERANCGEAGKIGHLLCGVCRHGKPRFICVPCLRLNALNTSHK